MAAVFDAHRPGANAKSLLWLLPWFGCENVRPACVAPDDSGGGIDIIEWPTDELRPRESIS